MESIILHVYYSGEPGQAKAFATEMQQSLRSQVLQEKGCLQYDYFVPFEDERKVLLIEHWASKKALSDHANGSVMEKLKQIKAKYALSTQIERYE